MAFFSFFTSLGNFFKKLFGNDGPLVQTVMTDISLLYNKAVPIVSAFSAVLHAEDMVNPTLVLKKTEGILAVFVTDAAKVETWVASHSGSPSATIISDAAQVALSFVSGVGILKDVELAISLAYQVYSKLNPGTTGKTVVVA